VCFAGSAQLSFWRKQLSACFVHKICHMRQLHIRCCNLAYLRRWLKKYTHHSNSIFTHRPHSYTFNFLSLFHQLQPTTEILLWVLLLFSKWYTVLFGTVFKSTVVSNCEAIQNLIKDDILSSLLIVQVDIYFVTDSFAGVDLTHTWYWMLT